MMSSKREEERNEKVIRGLLKLPPNRRCINCNGLGPQYVCTNFWTFVCTACSGIHREFTHRVKSVSMAKFTAQEVDALQNGGNQRARELFLKDWDMQSMKLPDSSYPDKIREFIKNVYVEKKYVGGRSSDKPPKDPQDDLKSHEEHRRASSYHSFSQSPPYDNQYEDRRYGKPKILLTRKPGSDHGHYEGNISSILYSPGRGREHMYEDKFANETSSSRISDYSASSGGDPFRSSEQSQRASLGSFWSFDDKSLRTKSTNSGALPNAVLQPENVSISKQPNKSTIASSETSTPQHTAMIDLFSLQFLQQQTTKTSVDLFADFTNQPSCIPPENKPASIPSSENDDWAMFDTVHQVAPDPEANKGLHSMKPPCIEKSKEIIDAFSSKQDTSQLFSDKKFTVHAEVTSTTDQWHTGLTEIQNAANSRSTPLWNAFDDSFQKNSLPLYVNSSSFGGQHTDVTLPKVLNENSLQFPVVLDKDLPVKNSSERMPSVTLSCEVSSTQEWKSTNPFDLSYDLDAGASNMFLDMTSLQSTLPNAQLPNAFLDGLSQPWFQHNSVPNFSPAIPQGIPYVGGQQLPNITSQGSAASGNPFA